MNERARARITLRDVARAAGVSVATASLALRQDPRIASGTAERVARQAEEMGYRPDPMLGALAAYRRGGDRPATAMTHVLGLLVPAEWPLARGGDAGWYESIYEGMESRARHYGYDLQIFALPEAPADQERLCRVLLQRGVRGLLLPPLSRPASDLAWDWSLFCTVSAGTRHEMAGGGFSSCRHDLAANVRLALERLQARGCHRIGYAHQADRERGEGQRGLGAFLAWNLEQGADGRSPALFLHERGLTETGSGDELRHLLARWLEREELDAVVTPYPSRGKAFQALVAWTAASDQPTAWVSVQAHGEDLCGVDACGGTVGAASVDLLNGQLGRKLTGVAEDQRDILIPGRWIERNN